MSDVIVKQRPAGPSEMDGDRVVMVLTIVDRGLWCEDCGANTREDTHVLAEPGGPIVATLTGCSSCRTGLFAR